MKKARVNRTFPLIIEIDGERHTIGEAQVNADGTFDCSTNMLNYHRTSDGGVDGFYFDPTTTGEPSSYEPDDDFEDRLEAHHSYTGLTDE